MRVSRAAGPLLTMFVWMVLSGWAAIPAHAVARNVTKDVETVLLDQVDAWNRGDIEAFMHGYKNSPDTTFIGKTVEHGYQMILDRYRKAYASHEAMGTLEFSDLDVRMLGDEHAVVTGKFHLARTAAGGGEASGLFSLVFEKTPQGWRIILDHTS